MKKAILLLLFVGSSFLFMSQMALAWIGEKDQQEPLVIEIEIPQSKHPPFPSFEKVEVVIIRSNPIKFHLPHGDSILEVPVQSAGIDEIGRMSVIDDPEVITWLELGSIPSESGNTILASHRDWKGKRGVLSELENMKVGEIVKIEMSNGDTVKLQLVSVNIYPLDEVPASVMQLDGSQRTTIITCGGRFDKNKGGYQDRVVGIFSPMH